MSEVWLRTNRRAILWAMLPAALMLATGVAIACGLLPLPGWTRWIGGAVALFSLVCLGALLWQCRLPRLAYADGHLQVHLRRGEPIRVPLHVVECFLLGQAPSRLPGKPQLKTTTVLIRLCPREVDWVRGDVDSRLGQWRDSHFVIHGTWCEPLDVEIVRRLNAQLGRVVREQRGRPTCQEGQR